ncbi:ankyrin repeat domain-containing protein 29-like [Periplaneta americana]|uniref:ankyrin repeat domain-containing protein 29-like n=1 Tax=Periplaneta americana TaxID=6978 RepID=UPI0037E910BA
MNTCALFALISTCVATGKGLILWPITNNTIRIPEGSNLVIEAYYESDETNLYWFAPGNRKLGAFDEEVTITLEEFYCRLEIFRVSRFRSGVYWLKGFDLYSNEKLNWTLIVEVGPIIHTSMDRPKPCYIHGNITQLPCTAPYTEEVIWQYFGCHVNITRAADREFIKGVNVCGKLTKLISAERQKRLREASREGDVTTVSMLIQLGAHPTDSESGVPILSETAELGHVEVTRLLLNAGADPSRTTTKTYGKTPLHYAAWSRSVQVAELLVGRGASVSARDKSGDSPLFEAVYSGYLPMVETFLSLGANVEERNRFGVTPLFATSWSGSVEIAEYLVKNGADVFAVDTDGETPLMYAAWRGRLRLVEAYLAWGIDPNAVTRPIGNVARTAMHYANESGSQEVINALVKATDTRALK